MYLEFYRLREFPYSSTCDERYYFESPPHAQALADMLYTVQYQRGMMLLVGGIGLGKTFLAQVLASRLGPGCQVLKVAHPADSGKQFLGAVARSLGMHPPRDCDKFWLVDALQSHLLKLQGRGRPVALVVDEGHLLADDALEELRLLWNWEGGGRRLIQIILMGQTALDERLRAPRWAPLVQRIVQSSTLRPLSDEETCRYVLHRRRLAKAEGCVLKFSRDGVKEIHRASGGVPRLINTVCESALMVGYQRQDPVITRPMVLEGLKDRTPEAAEAREQPLLGPNRRMADGGP